MTSRIAAASAAALIVCLSACLLILRLILWPRRRSPTAKRVCIYRIGHVGDTICAIPAMYAVRKAYPDAHLTLVTTPVRRDLPSAKDVLQGAEWIDQIKIYYNDEVATPRKGFMFFWGLRRERFDVWVELPQEMATFGTLVRNMISARIAGAKWACGWRQSLARFALRAQSEHGRFPNETERLMNILHDSGFETTREVAFPLPSGVVEESAIDALIREHSLDCARLVAIAPSAKRETNRWPVERFIEVGRYLVSRGFQVVVTGGGSDRGLCESIVRGIGRDAVNFAGRTSLKESCELLRRCRLLVCNDSGVQHMAVAVGTTCISLFSARDMPDKWNPYGSGNVVLRKWVECHTCYAERCPYDNLCMRMIEVSEVTSAIDDKIAQSQPSVRQTVRAAI